MDPAEPNIPHADAPPEPKPPPRVERDVNGLVARVDQLDAELETVNALLLMQAFAFGALIGIVILQARKLTELANAFAG